MSDSQQLRAGRRVFVAVSLQILTRDREGRPSGCRLVYDNDTTILVKGGEEFVTVYLPIEAVEPK